MARMAALCTLGTYCSLSACARTTQRRYLVMAGESVSRRERGFTEAVPSACTPCRAPSKSSLHLNFKATQRGVYWLHEVLTRFAPCFEFFSLPRFSSYAMLVRPRVIGRRPSEGEWVALQVKTTSAAAVNRASRMNFSRLSTASEGVSALCVCEGHSLIFAFSPADRPSQHTRFTLTASASSKYDACAVNMRKQPQDLPQALMRLSNDPLSKRGGLLDMIRDSNSLARNLRFRKLLVQSMELPILRDMIFPFDSLLMWNATLGKSNVLIRSVSDYGPVGRVMFSRRFGEGRPCTPFDVTSGIDLFVILFAHVGDTERLCKVGVFPAPVLAQRGILSTCDRVGKTNITLRRDGLLKGTLLEGLDPFCFPVDASPEKINAVFELARSSMRIQGRDRRADF